MAPSAATPEIGGRDTPRPRVLIVRLSSLGDIVQTLPVSQALRVHFPTATIVWLTRARYRELLAMNPAVDVLLLLPERRGWEVWARLRDLWRLLREIRRHHFDVALDLHAVVLSHLLVGLSGGRRKLGLDKRNDLGFRMFTRQQLPAGTHPHRIELYLQPLEFLAIQSPPVRFPLVTPAAARQRIAAFFEASGIQPADIVVTIHPGTAVRIKRWAPENFVALAARLLTEPGLRIIWIHAPEDRAAPPASLAGLLRSPPLDLPELAELLRRSDLVIGNDSGPLQLAAALGRRTVAIFGPSDPRVTGPRGSPSLILREELPCSPCYQDFRIQFICRTGTRACLRQLSVERVDAAVRQSLSALRQSPPDRPVPPAPGG